jgi:hypothetical protein
MEPTEVIVTNILPTGTSFGVLASDMTQNVFIPSKLALETGLRPGMKVMASVVPNAQQPEKTPWLAIALHDSLPAPALSLADRIRDELANGPATTIELARFLKVNSSEVLDALEAMKLARTDIWALEMDELITDIGLVVK